MRISRLDLSPFAGFSEKTLRFAPGLNVVLGANDVGKSSVFRAVESALFLRARVSKSTREGKELLPRVIPLKGDHARVSLEFTARGMDHRLEKTWGEGAEAALSSDGAKLAQEDRVEEALGALLPAPPATFKAVLLMGQGALEGTVATLERERDALHSLGDLLRVSVDQTAGVSVERLRARLAERIEKSFSHWDRAANMPEKGRGIEDPWTRNVGEVLKAFYARERLRKYLSETVALEAERDRKLASLNEKQAALDSARAFLRENEGFVTAATDRQALDGKARELEAEVTMLEKDTHAWLRAESEAAIARPEVERLEPRRKALDEELRGALAAAKRKDRQARVARARAAGAGVAEAKAKLAALPALKVDDVRRLRAAVREIDGLKAQAKGGKLQLQLHVKRELEVAFRKDFETERKGMMPAGKSMTLNAGGRIQLSNEWFELQVTGGEGSFGETEEKLRSAEDALARLFGELKVKSLEEADDAQSRITTAQAELRAAESEFSRALLPGEKLEDLEKAAAAEGAAGRDADVVRAELELVQGELDAKRKTLAAAEGVLQSLKERSGAASSGTLHARLLERRGVLSLLTAQREALPRLPEALGAADEFLSRFRIARDRLPSLVDGVGILRNEVTEVKMKMREESAQDLERSFREASITFDRELAAGRALLRVEEAVRGCEGDSGDLYGGFRAQFEERVRELSAGKYRQASLAESLPVDFERRDGAPIPFGWLSAGTKDAFALALRLAMAGYFLGSSAGFLLIDDPLVNMDPERQRVAAGMLREFAKERQVVVFTCHPHHAELLGGERIVL